VSDVPSEKVVEGEFIARLIFMAETPVHVGGTREANVLYALRLADGRLIIPASTWKGALRALAEKIAATMPLSGLERLAVERVTTAQDLEEARRKVGDLTPEFRASLEQGKRGLFDPADIREKLHSIGYSEEEMPSREGADLQLAEYLLLYCPVGRLFGNWARAGSLHFLDTILSSSTQRRPGVGVDRRRGTVQEHVLYTVETSDARMEVPLVFTGKLEGRGDSPSRLLASLLRHIDALGLNVGGRKSAGLGLLTLKEAEFYAFEPGRGEDGHGELLSRPFSAKPLGLEGFVKWLLGEK
jgi:CRISPR/Cas system CSM-associated protein Csm3 (group 7 of RAMP superfamily)